MSEHKYRASKPFSYGSEDHFFNASFCCRCVKYKLDEYGVGRPDNCSVEEAISHACFDDIAWPGNDIAWTGNDIVEVGNHSHVCLRFISDDEKVMKSYRALFEKGGSNP